MRYLLITGLLWAVTSTASAQVVTDGTVGPATALPGPDYAVTSDLGRLEGTNLFHSFSLFDVNTGESATFSGPNSIQNIIARVTGNNASDIDGTLASTIGGADVFFINPAGVIFGPNASLDIGGSFHVSTADEVRFPDGGLYSALDPAGSVFTTAAPEAFGFLNANPASILIDRSDLSLPEGENLSLVGGDITIQGEGGDIAEIPFDDARNSIVLPGGDLTLVSVASPGAVAINPAVGADGFAAYGDITIKDSFVDLSGEPAGGVYIRGGDVLVENTWMFAFSDGAFDGGDFAFRGDTITIQADRPRLPGGDFFETPTIILVEAVGGGRGGDLHIDGGDIAALNGTLVIADTFGPGPGGDVTITGNSLTIRNGAQILADTFSSGPGGDLIVEVTDIFISEDDTRTAGLFTDALGSGDGGDLIVNADTILLFDEGSIETFSGSGGTGDAGDLFITAREIVVDDFQRARADFAGRHDIGSTVFGGDGNVGTVVIVADSITVRGVGAIIGIEVHDGSGDGGTLIIRTGTLEVLEGGQIFTVTSASESPGGDMLIEADFIRIANETAEVPSGIGPVSSPCFSCGNTILDIAGNAGNLTINTGVLQLDPGGNLFSDSLAIGDAGSIVVNADLVRVQGDGTIFSIEEFGGGFIEFEDFAPNFTGFFSIVRAETGGTAGNITINAPIVELGGGAVLATSTAGQGGGGTITINADSLSLLGGARLDASTVGVGDGGNIVINVTGSVVAQGTGGSLVVNSFSTEPDAGLAGSIFVTANELRIEDGAVISTDSAVADGGNITIDVAHLVYASDAAITTSVGDGTGAGGNIVIDPVFVVLDSSAILANAFGGPGGNITIVADNFIASADSVIEASSALGIDGTVTVDAPEADLSGNVTVLPDELLSAAEQLAAQCSARGGRTLATFVGRGRSGLPAQAGDAIVALYRSEGAAGPSDQGKLVLPGHLQIACHVETMRLSDAS
jgi:filamentous hemagglutinin family protein